MKTNLISGVTATYAIWSGNQQTEIYRMNIIGKLTGLYEFDDNAALARSGLGTLTREQDYAFADYWH